MTDCKNAESGPGREPKPDDLSDLIDFMVDQAAAWVERQRNRYRPTGRGLSEVEKGKLQGFFPEEVLEEARIATVPRIENPDFYSQLEAAGFKPLLDLTGAAGIAFIDTVVIAQVFSSGRGLLLPLLFHELVHVVQHRVLGLKKFMRLYIQSWADGGFSYYAISLEKQAFDLQARYQADPNRLFSVEDEVSRWI